MLLSFHKNQRTNKVREKKGGYKNMEMVKIFWKANCSKCPAAKDVGNTLKEEGFKVIDYNLDTLDGLAEGAYYSVMATPTLIIEDRDENCIADFRGIIPSAKEIQTLINKNYR
jgi:hypothetical protein